MLMPVAVPTESNPTVEYSLTHLTHPVQCSIHVRGKVGRKTGESKTPKRLIQFLADLVQTLDPLPVLGGRSIPRIVQ